MTLFHDTARLHRVFLYGAYGWLLLSGILHFAVDVVSQYGRGKRLPSPETTLYYGLNTTYALSQFLFAALALLALQQGMTALGKGPGLVLGFVAAGSWFALCQRFMEYTQPRITVVMFVVMLAGATLTGF